MHVGVEPVGADGNVVHDAMAEVDARGLDLDVHAAAARLPVKVTLPRVLVNFPRQVEMPMWGNSRLG
jgi:hypothetical protein